MFLLFPGIKFNYKLGFNLRKFFMNRSASAYAALAV